MIHYCPNRVAVLNAVGNMYKMVDGTCAVMVSYRGSTLAIPCVAELQPTILTSTIFPSLARANECVHIHSIKEISLGLSSTEK